jgi:hypothetical protein
VAATPLTWVTRFLWLVLPLTLGELLGDAAADRATAVGVVTAVAAWAVWAAGLLASLVALPITLTVLRVLAPLPVVAGALAALAVTPSPAGWFGLGAAAVLSATAMSAEVGDWFVNGASYGDERRMPLRVPTALLLGPIEGVWLLTTLPVLGGLVLLADGTVVVGALLTVAGVATAVTGFRTLDRLSRRWIVFVPAGVTLVDDLALAEPILFPRARIVRLGPALVGTDALDLTVGAGGLIIEVDLDGPLALLPAVRRGGVAEAVEVTSVLMAPGRPGEMLAHAEGRKIAVSRT